MTIAVDLGRKATTKQTTAFLYKTLRDIVLMVDRSKGAILEFIAIVSWVYCFEDNASVYIKAVYRHLRMCKCRSALVGGREWRSLTLLWLYISYLRSSIVVHVLFGFSTCTRYCSALCIISS